MSKAKLNILNVVHYFLPNHLAGTEVLTYNLSKEFQKRGHSVSVFCSEPDKLRYNLYGKGGFYEDLQVFRVFNDYSHVKNFLDIYENERIDSHFGTYLDRVKPDVVHFHHLSGLSFGMIDECKKRDIPILYSMHDFWLMCPQGQRRNNCDKSLCDEVDFKKCANCMKFAFVNRSFLLARIFRRLFPEMKMEKDPDGRSLFYFALNHEGAKKISPPNHIWIVNNSDEKFLGMHPNSKIIFKNLVFNKGDSLKFKLSIHHFVKNKITGIVQFKIIIGDEIVFDETIDTKDLIKKRSFDIELQKTGKNDFEFETHAIGAASHCMVGWSDLCLIRKTQEQLEHHFVKKISRIFLNLMLRVKRKKNSQLPGKRDELIRSKISFFDKMIAPTPFLYEEFKKWSPTNLLLSEDGIESSLFENFSKNRNLKEEIRFAFIGTIHSSKGVHVLIEAFNNINNENIYLDIYGDENVYPSYYAKIKELSKNPNVNFLGTFEKNQVAEVYKKFDVLIVPSIWFENAPLVIRNAILSKTPVICSDLPGMNFLIKHNKNGLNFKMGDPIDLLQQIERLRDNTDLMEEFAGNMLYIKTIKDNVKELEGYYYDILEQRNKIPQQFAYSPLEKPGYKVSIVMPTFNGDEYLDEVLHMVTNQKVDFEFEIVVVDSGSSDRTLEILDKYEINYHSIDKKTFNHGLTRNLAISKSKGEIIVMLTQDAIPSDENWLANILKPYDDEDVVGVYVKQIPRDDCNIIIEKRINSWIIGENQGITNSIDCFEQYDKFTPYEKYRLTNFDDVCSSLRRSFWEKNPYKKMDFAEDLRFGVDAILAGKKIVYTPDSAVIHSHNRPLRYEYKRTYIAHVTLLDLYDLEIIASFKFLIISTFYAIIKDIKFVWGSNISFLSKLRYSYYALFFSIFSNIAGYNAFRDFHKGKVKQYKGI